MPYVCDLKFAKIILNTTLQSSTESKTEFSWHVALLLIASLFQIQVMYQLMDPFWFTYYSSLIFLFFFLFFKLTKLGLCDLGYDVISSSRPNG